MFKKCPECGAKTIELHERLRVEFFGGYVVCASCRAHFHINHRYLYPLAVEAMFIGSLVVVGVLYRFGWWGVPPVLASLMLVGCAVAILSPLTPVEPTKRREPVG